MLIWEWDLSSNVVSCKWICKGHERSVESLRADPSASMIATGSWDGMLKVWSATTSIDKRDVKILEAATADSDQTTEKVKTRVRKIEGWLGIIFNCRSHFIDPNHDAGRSSGVCIEH